MNRWDDLAVVLALHRTGTMAGAGEALGVNASTASRRLRALEDALGASLFDRTPDGLRATDLTRRLLPHAEAAEAAVLAAEAEVSGSDRGLGGTVRLAIAEGFAVYSIAPRLPSFKELHPRVRLHLVVGVELVDLTRREADIALRFSRPSSGDLVAKRIGSTGPYVAAAHRSYLARYRKGRPHTVLGWSEERAHLPDAQLSRAVLGEPHFASTEMVTLIEALRAGAGVMLLPRALVSQFEGVEVLDPIAVPPVDLPVFLVAHRAIRPLPRVAAVWAWLEDMLHEMGDEPRGFGPQSVLVRHS